MQSCENIQITPQHKPLNRITGEANPVKIHLLADLRSQGQHFKISTQI